MSRGGSDDLSSFSMADLFRMEAETQAQILSTGLVELENVADQAPLLEELMRAAHSLKGAARIVNFECGVRIAHAMEDCFVAAQEGKLTITPQRTDYLLSAVDMLTRLSAVGEDDISEWEQQHETEIAECVSRLNAPEDVVQQAVLPPVVPMETAPPVEQPPANAPAAAADTSHRALRITAENLNRLLGLAGESLLSSRWLETFAQELAHVKMQQQEVISAVDHLTHDMSDKAGVADLKQKALTGHNEFLEKLHEFEFFQRTFSDLSHRLYQEVLDSRMRPFGDVVQGFRRMVRDVARSLGKEVRLDIQGLATPIDRDILDRLEAPLSHLLRNALDHGVELPDERVAAGKPAEGTLKLEARHSAGTLLIQITDDGAGVNMAELKESIVRKSLTTQEMADNMTEAELLQFLFLPGFSTKNSVTEISGRGVGLDAVQVMARDVGGSIRMSAKQGKGTQFQLILPITLSVLRTLIVEIAGEPYAFPLARIHSATISPAEKIDSVEGRQHFLHHDQHVGLVLARQVLGLEMNAEPLTAFPVVVLDDHGQLYGLVVDRFLDERELVVLPLDPRLGKIPNISSAALMPDRSPVLIFDTEDLVRSFHNLISGERLHGITSGDAVARSEVRNRILVVDDSLTVRELERKLLAGAGYDVDVAVDGMDGWNAARIGRYDLIVTDVDMPRMDGIELVTLVRNDPRLKAVPVIIVSYKDRAEDRQRGLEAGADYYLTKSSFQDETFTKAVRDLIGEAVK